MTRVPTWERNQRSRLGEMQMEGVRRRVVTVYSQQAEERNDDVPEEPLPDNSEQQCREENGNIAQIRAVARSMFESMCKGDKGDSITEDNLESAIQNLSDASMDPTKSLVRAPAYAAISEGLKSTIRKLLKDCLHCSTTNEVTVDAFCEAAVRHCEGDISLLDMLDDKIAVHVHVHNETPPPTQQANLESLFHHPFETAKLLKQSILMSVEKQGTRWLWSNFTTKQFYWFLVVYFLPMMTLQVLVSSISTALFNGAMLCMILITIQIAICSEKFQSRQEYLSLFQYFNTEGDPIQIFSPKLDAIHYVTFSLGVVVATMSLGFSNHSFVYYELLAIASLVLCIAVLLQFDLIESRLVWFSIVAKTPGWLTVMIEKLFALFTLPPPQFLHSLRDPFFVFPVFGELRFEVNFVTVVQLLAHVALLAVEIRHVDWRMFFSKLGPHFLFLTWFVFCREFVSGSSPLHLVVISTLVILSPIYTFLFLLSPVYFFFYYGFAPPFYYSISSIAILAIFSLIVILLFQYRKSWLLNLSLEYVVIAFLVFCLCFVVFVCGWYTSLYQPLKPLPLVTQEEYGRFCGPENWDGGKNMVQTQMNCMHLQGRVFSASARVVLVGIHETKSREGNSILSLPSVIQSALTCHLGQNVPMCGNRPGMSTCVENGCHFRHTLTYTFKVKIDSFEDSKTVTGTLLVSDSHKEFVLKLATGTVLNFNATFVSGMGSDHLTLQALHLSADGLEDTQEVEEEREEEIKKSMLSTLLRSIKNSIVVILQIFLGYVIK